MKIDDVLNGARIIPVLEVAKLGDAAIQAKALSSGGLNVIELTLRTTCAIDAMVAMRDAAPELCIGMGTVRNAADVEKSVKAGA